MDPNAVPMPASGAPPARKTSPWIYVGCGCVILILLAIVVMYFVGRNAVHFFQHTAEEMKDPVKREARARSMLHYHDLPEGYYPNISMPVPFVFDMVTLTDQESLNRPGPHGTLDVSKRLFMYMKFLHASVPADDDARRKMLANRGGGNSWSPGFRLDVATPVGEGSLTAGNAKVYYRATRGYTNLNGHSQNAVTAMLIIACPDNVLRTAIWTVHDPDPDATNDTLDKTNTPADPKAITTFLNHFDLCAADS
jgi:hypothetical protein